MYVMENVYARANLLKEAKLASHAGPLPVVAHEAFTISKLA